MRTAAVRARPLPDMTEWKAGDRVEARIGGVWRNAEVLDVLPKGTAPESSGLTAGRPVRLLLHGTRLWLDMSALRKRGEPWKGNLGLSVLSAERAAAAMAHSQARKRDRSRDRQRDRSRPRLDGSRMAYSLGFPRGIGANGFPLQRSASTDSTSRWRGVILDGLRADFILPTPGCANSRLRWEIPVGVSGGQTLLLSIRRQPEVMEIEVPQGATAGTLLLAHTSLGHMVHIATPPNAVPGSRIVVSVPLPPQGVNVRLPREAKPGMAVTITLPKPVVEVGGNDDGITGQGGQGRDRALKRGHGGAYAALGSGAFSGYGTEGTKRHRRAGMVDVAAMNMAAEAQAYLRALEPCGRSADAIAMGNEQIFQQLCELYARPEMVDTWLMCEVLLKRLQQPVPSLAELEGWLCAMPCVHVVGELAVQDFETASRASCGRAFSVKPDALGALHAEILIQLLHEATPAAPSGENAPLLADAVLEAWLRQDGWMHALGVALGAGLWRKAYPDTVCPFVSVEAAEKSLTPDCTHKGSKFGEWVTEIGPPLCGTYGCILPNNHAGLHQLPESERGSRGGRSRRESGPDNAKASDTAAQADKPALADEVCQPHVTVDPILVSAASAISCVASASTLEQRVKGLVPYAKSKAVERMMALRALCLSIVTPSEQKRVRTAGSRLYLGSCLDADYWAIPSASRVYRIPRQAGNADIPVGSAWTAVSLERDDFVAFGTTLARCCVAHCEGAASASRSGAACYAVLNRLRDRVPASEHPYLEPPPPPEPLWEPEPEPVKAGRPRTVNIRPHSESQSRSDRKEVERRRSANVGKRERSAAPAEAPIVAATDAASKGNARAVNGVAILEQRPTSPPRVRVQLRAQRVPIGHRQVAVRACLKLTVPRHRRLSSTLRFHQQDAGP
mgnify:CR=1 FL=1